MGTPIWLSCRHGQLSSPCGWAGPRDEWSRSSDNVRGAGVGVSFLDGLARIDLARGLDPHTVWRMHLYVEATF